MKKFTSLTKANQKIESQMKELSKKRAEIKTMPMKEALSQFASVSAGAAAVGVVKGQLGDELMGVPTPAAGALVTVTAGYFMRSPMLIGAAAGMLAPYIAEKTEDLI